MAIERTVRGWPERWAVTAGLALALVLGARPGLADEPATSAPSKFAQFLAEHKAAVEAEDMPAQIRLLGWLCDLASKPPADPKDSGVVKAKDEDRKTVRGLCRKALGSSEQELVVTALTGYGTLQIPGSSAELKSFVDAKLGEKRALRVRLAAMAAWAAIHDVGTHAILLEHIRLPRPEEEKKSLAVAAARGLAEYKAVPKGAPRYDLLREFMQMFETIWNSSNAQATAEGGQWWQMLAPVMVKTFNVLTQAGTKDYAACIAWWRDNRRKIQAGTD